MNNTIESLETRYTTLHEEASERFHEMIEPAVLQEHVDKHKTQVDELHKEVGDLQADVTELTEDNSWYQDNYQEAQAASEAPLPTASGNAASLPVGAAPLPTAAGNADPLPAGQHQHLLTQGLHPPVQDPRQHQEPIPRHQLS